MIKINTKKLKDHLEHFILAIKENLNRTAQDVEEKISTPSTKIILKQLWKQRNPHHQAAV